MCSLSGHWILVMCPSIHCTPQPYSANYSKACQRGKHSLKCVLREKTNSFKTLSSETPSSPKKALFPEAGEVWRTKSNELHLWVNTGAQILPLNLSLTGDDAFRSVSFPQHTCSLCSRTFRSSSPCRGPPHSVLTSAQGPYVCLGLSSQGWNFHSAVS